MKLKSTQIVILLSVVLILLSQVYYPKWKYSGTEATISWDVAGYYAYLPAVFIYKDLKKCTFAQEVKKTYNPTPNFPQGLIHANGNHVMKYSIGQAISFLPAFICAHIYASQSLSIPNDGFSSPYQFSISIWSLLVAIIGLVFLRKALLLLFEDYIVSVTLLLLVLGSNYLDYASITGAMTHNYLFTINSVILYVTIMLYREPTIFKFIILGALIGQAALTRPTEILICLIPILWFLDKNYKHGISRKIEFFRRYKSWVMLSILTCLAMGSMQLIYWKYVSGEWIIYSYSEQGFSWLQPHLWNGIMSYRSGWLVYSPIMVFSLMGFATLYAQSKRMFYPALIYFLLFTYVTFAWDIWWYGGSLGQRAMIQSYPILAIPLASFIAHLRAKHVAIRIAVYISTLVFIYFNLWFTHQAHKGGLLHAGAMTKAYFWKVLGTYAIHPEHVKLLDTDEYYNGVPERSITLLDTTFKSPVTLNTTNQYSPTVMVSSSSIIKKWVRVTGDISSLNKEENVWQMTQLIARFKNETGDIKSRFIRIQRFINSNERKEIFMDIKVPNSTFDRMEIQYWHAGSNTVITLHNIRIETFQ